MRLHPKRNCGLDAVAQVATAFPRWQVSVVVSAEFLRHFSKDIDCQEEKRLPGMLMQPLMTMSSAMKSASCARALLLTVATSTV